MSWDSAVDVSISSAMESQEAVMLLWTASISSLSYQLRYSQSSNCSLKSRMKLIRVIHNVPFHVYLLIYNVCATARMWQSEDSSWEFVLFPHMGPGINIEVSRLRGEHIDP